MMCIYKITDLENGKIYIGQTVNLKRRIKEYRTAANGITKSSQKYQIYEIFNSKGFNNFRFDVLEEIYDKDLLDDREIYWIKKLNARDPKVGYNSKTGGRGGKMIDSSIEKMRKSSYGFRHTDEEKLRRSKSIYVVSDLDHSVQFFKSRKAYANECGVDRAMISHALKRGIKFRDVFIFPADKNERDNLYEELLSKKTNGGHNAKYSFKAYKSAYSALNKQMKKCRD